MATIYLIPNGAGDYTNIANVAPAVDHYLNMDDPVGTPDDGSTIVYTSAATYEKDAYHLGASTWTKAPSGITVTVYFRFQGDSVANNRATPYLRLGGVETTGTEVSNGDTSYHTHSEVLARPGGGDWTSSDFDDLQVAIGLKQGSSWIRATQIYIKVDYTESAVDSTKHDIGFLRQDKTTSVPMMLAQEEGVPRYWISDEEYIADPIRGETRVDREITILEDDWRGGFGLKIADPNYPHRYHYGTNIDARFKNEVRCGPLATTITKPTVTAATLANGNMEANSDWTTESGQGERSNTQAHGGTYSWKVTASANNVAIIYQEPTWNAEYQGRTFHFGCWVYGLGGAAKIQIDDGVDTTESSVHNGDSTWQYFAVEKRLSTSATKLSLEFYTYGTGGASRIAYFDDAVLYSPTVGTIANQTNFAGERYATYGNILMRLNSAGTAFDYVWTAPADTITDLFPSAISGTDYLFVCLGWDKDYYYVTNDLIENCDSVWNELVDGDVTATADTDDYKVGTASLSLEVAAGCAAGDILATQVITSKDFTNYQLISMWVKSTTSLDKGDIELLLDDEALCISPDEAYSRRLEVPAVAANTWTFVTIPLTGLYLPTAAISIGIEMDTDKGAFTLNIDEIRTYSFIETDLTGAELKQMTIVGQTFWGSDTNNSVKYTAAPLAGGTNWAAGKSVGDDSHDIVDLVEYGGLLYIKKEDKPYYKDTSGDIQVLSNETEHLGGTNDQPFYIWHDILFMPYGEQGLLIYDGTSLGWISPSLYSTGAGDFVGEVRALAGDDHWLYVVLDDGADVQLMAVRNEVVAGTAEWRWHPLAELTIAGCASLGLTSVYKKRLYVGSTSSANSFTWYPVTTKYGSIDDDTDYKYQTNGYLYSSWLHGGYKGDIKAFIKQTLTMSHTYDADIDFTVHYRLWGATSWSSVGVFDGASGVRTETQYIDVANKPSSTLIQFRIQFVTDDTAKTPILNSSDLRAIMYPTRRNLIKCVARCADNILDKMGGALGVTAATIRATLIEAKNTATYPVTFYDIFGNTKYVRLLSADPFSVVIKDEKGRNIEELYMLTMQEVTLS